MVDANVANKSFNYLANLDDYSVVSSLTGTSLNDYFKYQFSTSGYTMFNTRVEKGWTAEFILNYSGATAPLKNVLFYMGKIENGLSGTTTSGETKDFIDNNFLIYLDSNNKVIIKQIKYKTDCDCDTPSNVINEVLHKSNVTIPTGVTNQHLVIIFERDLKLNSEEMKYKGNNLDCSNFPNNHWYDGQKFRFGKIKIYLNGLLKTTISGVEEPVFRDTTFDLPFVQGWGISDENSYYLTDLYNMAGSFTGNIIRGRFYNCVLNYDDIKTNFELFSDTYNMLDPLTSC